MAVYATTALEIVSLDALKDELRLDRTFVDHDALFESQLKASVSFVENLIGRSLILKNAELMIATTPDGSSACSGYSFRFGDYPFRFTPGVTFKFCATDYVSLTSMSYVKQGAAGYSVVPATVYSAPVIVGENTYHIYLKADQEWPSDNQFPNPIKLKYKQCIDLEKAEALKQAVIVLARQFYDGYSELRPSHAVLVLSHPFRLGVR